MELTLDQARAICAHLSEASALCDESLQTVKSNDGIGMTQVYARLVGHFLGHSYTNILGPIWAQFPELEPEEMKQPYEDPIAALSVASLAAIDRFLSVAAPALAQAEQLLGVDAVGRLPFGGLPEVKNSIVEIEEFRNRPRFMDATTADPES
jgi:hypothetical protein